MLSLVILCIILLLVFILDLRNRNDCENASFWSDRKSPDHVLMAGYVAQRQGDLPPNRIINKGYNSEYWDCYELQRSLGTPENEVLNRCKKFV